MSDLLQATKQAAEWIEDILAKAKPRDEILAAEARGAARQKERDAQIADAFETAAVNMNQADGSLQLESNTRASTACQIARAIRKET